MGCVPSLLVLRACEARDPIRCVMAALSGLECFQSVFVTCDGSECRFVLLL